MANELLLTSQGINAQQISCSFWDYANGNVLQIYKNGGNVSPKTLAVMGTDYLICGENKKPLLHIWPLNSQEPLKNIRLVLPEAVNCLSVCPKSTYLAVGISSKLYIWELSSGKLLNVQQIHYQPITCIKFSNSGGFLVIAGEDGMVVTYNVVDLVSIHSRSKAQSELGQVEPLYKRMDNLSPINDICIGNFSFKSRFTTVSNDQTLRLYQLVDGQLLLTLIFDTPLTSVIFNSPCTDIYVGNSVGLIRKFELTDPPRSIEHHVDDTNKSELCYVGHKKKIVCLDINIFNNRLASASEDCNVFIWELHSRQILRKLEFKTAPTNLKFVLTSEHIFGQNYQPQVILSSLDRNMETDLSETYVSVLQTEEIKLRDSIVQRKYGAEVEAIQDLQAQVLNLHKINLDLFTQLQQFKSQCSS